MNKRLREFLSFGCEIGTREATSASSRLTSSARLRSGAMADKTYIVRFRRPDRSIATFVASRAEIHGDHIVLLNSHGQLAALLLLDIVESWNEI